MPDQSEAPIVRDLTRIVRTADALWLRAELEKIAEAAEIIRLCEEKMGDALEALNETVLTPTLLNKAGKSLEAALAQIKGQNP